MGRPGAMIKRTNISCEELTRLYSDELCSAPEIAERVGCSVGTIYTRLDECGIPIRNMSDAARLDRGVEISCETLHALYVDKQLSFAEIAERCQCSPATIHRRLKACGIEARPVGGSACEYPKKDFDGGPCSKAYLIGLRLGDLHIEQGSRAIRVRCTSTCQEQITLIQELFMEYGGIWISKPQAVRGTGITVHLNRSFDFLLPHEDGIESWILDDNELFAAFWAGYLDAEGSFIVSGKRAYFKVDSGDKGILNQAWMRLGEMGLEFQHPKLVRPAGTWISQFQLTSRRDLWRLASERKETLLQLCDLLTPHLRHRTRIHDMEAVRANVEARTHRRIFGGEND
jgi:predicted DNA-binding protein YlxM (UPF0122 family)